MSQNKLNTHLVSNIPNTDENRAFIKDVNKKARASKSKWRLMIRYRKPKEGFGYSYGGGLKRENANAFSVYIDDKTPYNERHSSRLWDKIHNLEAENKVLKHKLIILDNPYGELSLYELEEKLEDLKEEAISTLMDYEEAISREYRDKFTEKYDYIVEMINHKEKNIGLVW